MGAVKAREAWIAWGSTGGRGNTIGRDSRPLGPASVELGGKHHETTGRNWMHVTGLAPDTAYPFRVLVNGAPFGSGELRTMPERTTRLRFFVMGDYGTGADPQYRIARAMEQEFARHAKSDNPVRFLITTGDNVYGTPFGLYTKGSGDRDRHWARRYFEPYKTLLRHIPFYPSPGNHDGNESENRGDLAVYLDNFFFPTGRPERWYSFDIGGLAQFYSIDSTRNSATGPRRNVWRDLPEQRDWLRAELAKPAAPWRIAYWHHPPFTAGPRHEASLSWMRDAVDMLARGGVTAVFNGHEHNLQIVNRNEATGGVQYIVSGSGGELRDGDIRQRLDMANITGASSHHQFLSVEIDGGTMRVMPLGYEPIVVRDGRGGEVKMPIEIRRR